MVALESHGGQLEALHDPFVFAVWLGERPLDPSDQGAQLSLLLVVEVPVGSGTGDGVLEIREEPVDVFVHERNAT